MTEAIPEPIELCLEELEERSGDEPYLRCVAVAGGHPGLCFSPQGEVWWQLNQDALAELWVSMDGQLIFYRTGGLGVVSLTRASRHLELPVGKPVVVLHGDEVRVEGRSYRVHVHGRATQVAPPERLTLRRAHQAVVGAALAASALAAGCEGDPPGANIHVLVAPPSAAPTPAPTPTQNVTPTGSEPAAAGPRAPSTPTSTQNARQPNGAPIEVRVAPPAPMTPPPPLLRRPTEPPAKKP